MSVVSEVDGEALSRGSDLEDDPVIARGGVVVWLIIAACVIVVASILLLLVVQAGKKSAPSNQPGSLCWDSGMQMEMPCSTAP
jgi:hypothetical protein